MSILRNALPKVYGWLNQHDRNWLKKNRPKLIKRQIVKFSVDWKRRDSEYNALVKQAANRIRTANRRPVRITKTAIGKDLGVVSMFQKHIDKLPLTKRTLTSVIESSADFSSRRVLWAANCYLQEGVLAQQWQLILRANVYRNREVSEVRQAIVSGLKMLRSKLFRRGAAA